MAIKVKLNDGNAEVGGEFNRALSFVKGFEGRKYDAATKTWTVPMSVHDFIGRCNSSLLPVEYSGVVGTVQPRHESGHQTKYGNRYSNDEWQAMNEARKVGGEAAAKLQDKVEAAEKALREAQMSLLLAATGGNTEAAGKLYRTFVGFNARFGTLSVEEVEANGGIQFSSAARRTAVIEAVDACHNHPLLKALLDAWQEQEDAESVAQAEVYDRYGVFQ